MSHLSGPREHLGDRKIGIVDLHMVLKTPFSPITHPSLNGVNTQYVLANKEERVVAVWCVAHTSCGNNWSRNVSSSFCASRLNSKRADKNARYTLISWQGWVTPKITQVTISVVVPTNLGILIFAVLYEVFLALDAIHNKNNILLFAICISNTCTFAYSIMQYQVMGENIRRMYEERYISGLVVTTHNVWTLIKPAEIIVAIITGIVSILLWPIAYFLHKDYSWAIYKVVHGSPKTRIRYLVYEVQHLP